MRILFITQVVDRSDDNLGAVHGWIDALARKVDRVHVIALRTGIVELPPNVSVYSLGKDLGNGKARQLRIFHSVAGRLAFQHQIDAFFPHMVPRYALLVAPYRALLKIPSVMWYAHNSGDIKLKMANLCVDRFVTVSKDSFPLGPAKCEVVGHGIDTDLFKPPENEPCAMGKIRFLSLGRISPRKELDTLVSAADLLVHRWGRRDLEFVVAGGPLTPSDRDYFHRIQDRVRDLGMEDLFQFTGGIPHSETVHYVQACDFFVNMHVEGGLGKAVLEAMSCGKPAFVSTPTYYDRFPSYGSTFLFRPRDYEDLALKMNNALDISIENRSKIGNDLRAWVIQEHDVHRQMSRIVDVFRSLERRQ
ncbi:MAG: glycosyltransferase family 4 protein [Chloroflexota bacterium]|jgi:glycosyltransferase involved in cell wall biosynthesis